MANYYDFYSIPSYVIGSGVLSDLKRIILGLGSRYLVVVDRHATPELRDTIARSLGSPLDAREPVRGDNVLGAFSGLADDVARENVDEDISFEFCEAPSKACTRANAEEMGAAIAKSGADVVVAVGGGKCLDLVRAGVHFCGGYRRPAIVIVPTVVTSNACATGISIMYDDAGEMHDFWNLARLPECLIVDVGLIAGAPRRYLAAGIGDQASSSIEALHALERIGGLDAADPFCVAHHRSVLEVLLEHGAAAVEAVGRGEVTHQLEWVCHALTRYTGPQMAIATPFLSHVLDEALITIPQVARLMHGEIVGFGVLPDMVAFGAPEKMPPWIDLFEKIGIPCTLAELGIPDASYDDIRLACEKAAGKIMASVSVIRWTPDQMAEAVLEADRLSRAYLTGSR